MFLAFELNLRMSVVRCLRNLASFYRDFTLARNNWRKNLLTLKKVHDYVYNNTKYGYQQALALKCGP